MADMSIEQLDPLSGRDIAGAKPTMRGMYHPCPALEMQIYIYFTHITLAGLCPALLTLNPGSAAVAIADPAFDVQIKIPIPGIWGKAPGVIVSTPYRPCASHYM